MSGLQFRSKLAEAVVAGRKTETRRLLSDNPNSPWWRERCGFKIGKDYVVQPGRGKPQIGRVQILDVRQVRLGAMTEVQARAEGAESLADFRENIWPGIHGTYDPQVLVWALRFERWTRYAVMVPGGTTKLVNRHLVEDRAGAEAILPAKRSYWIIDQRTARRVELGELP